MEHQSVLLILLLFFCFGLMSKRVDGSMLTPPMLFTGAGLLMSGAFLDLVEFPDAHAWTHILLEATLVLVLFSDAARVNMKDLLRDHIVPQRMLVIGMPLTILFGGLLAFLLPLGLNIYEAALLAAILTPTDAALGQAVMNSEKIPERIRQSINVESGLNDGIALPVILIFASITSALATSEMVNWVEFVARQLFFGPLVGIGAGLAGAVLLNHADTRGWMSASGQGMFSLVLAGMSFVIAESLQGNGFISAFLAGLVFGNKLDHKCEYLFEFVETEGQLLTLSSFFVFGALLLPPALLALNPWHWVYALLSLTVLRMLPIALSLTGLHLKMSTKLFLGWFGPRGLASILFVLLVLHETVLPDARAIVDVVFVTVLLSIFAHGCSAAPLARLYGEAAAHFHGYEEHRAPHARRVLKSRRA